MEGRLVRLSVSALLRTFFADNHLYSLRHYANDVLQMDEFWFVDTYKTAPQHLPAPKESLSGASVVPWRYNLNTGELPKFLAFLIGGKETPTNQPKKSPSRTLSPGISGRTGRSSSTGRPCAALTSSSPGWATRRSSSTACEN